MATPASSENHSVWKSGDVVRQYHEHILVGGLQFCGFYRQPNIKRDDVGILDKPSARQIPKLYEQKEGEEPVDRQALVEMPKAKQSASAAGLYNDLPPGCIRVLEVLPGDDEQINLRLHVVLLEKNKYAYDALSYTWKLDTYQSMSESTQEDTTVPVQCNGIAIDVQRNLYNALQRIRNNSISMLWVDALCINQQDAIERGCQVGIMSEIYKNAFQVLIWLGEGDEEFDVSGCFREICSLVNTWACDAPIPNSIPRATFSRHTTTNADTDTSEGDSAAFRWRHDYIARWRNILKLYKSRWFYRVWVVQEVALARSGLVMLRDFSISWEWIGLAAAIIRTNHDEIVDMKAAYKYTSNVRDQLVPTGVLNAYFMYRLSRSQRLFEPLKFSFHQLLKLTRQFGCSDNRDKIFGLLAIPTTDQISQSIVPDYKSGDAEIYQKVAWMIIEGSNSLDILSSVQRRPDDNDIESSKSPWLDEPKSDPTVPSWIPQWHFARTQTLNLLEPDPSFAASLGLPARVPTPENPSRLLAGGFLIDKAANITYPYEYEFEKDLFGGGGIILRPSNAFLESIDTRLKTGLFTKADMEDIAVTLTAGKNWYGLPVHDSLSHVAGLARCLNQRLLVWSLVGNAHSSATSQEESLTNETMNALAEGGDDLRFLDAAGTACRERAYFVTESGMRGVGPKAMKEGDSICILYGANVPFVIRPEGDAYILIGECYIRRLMHGERIQEKLKREGEHQESWIEFC